VKCTIFFKIKNDINFQTYININKHMEMVDERYKRGKIYTIRCRYDDTLIYVGSTIQSLSLRIASHRREKDCSLYQLVNGDWKNWYIELYEEYPCNNKQLLERREGEVQREIATINKQIAGRTKKEYWKQYYEDNRDKIKEKYQNNRDKISEKAKQYYKDNREKFLEKYQDNSDKIKEKRKEHYQNNRDKIKEKRKEHYQNNREIILEKMKEKTECDRCGSIVNKGDLAKHKKN